MAEPIKRGVVGGLGKTALYTAVGALLGPLAIGGIAAVAVGAVAGFGYIALGAGIVAGFLGATVGAIGGGTIGAITGASKVYDDANEYDRLKHMRAHGVSQNVALAREEAIGQGAQMGYQQGFMEGQVALANQIQAQQAQQTTAKEDCNKCVSHVKNEEARRAAAAAAGHSRA